MIPVSCSKRPRVVKQDRQQGSLVAGSSGDLVVDLVVDLVLAVVSPRDQPSQPVRTSRLKLASVSSVNELLLGEGASVLRMKEPSLEELRERGSEH